MKIVPFAEGHLDAAAELLAARHRRHREAEPLLPADVDFRALIEDVLDNGGTGAFSDGGYVLGTRLDDEMWGPNIWVESPAHAVRDPEFVRDLYAFTAYPWVDDGRTRHYVQVPACDQELLGVWFRLGFGQQQALGVRELPETIGVTVPNGYSIRPPDPTDIEALIDVDLALPAHQHLSPIFSDRLRTDREESRREWESTFAESDEEILIGYRGDQPVACWSIVGIAHSRQHAGLAQPEKACYLTFAVTLPDARGSGIGVALTDACFVRARELGYETIVTDWRVTNLLASRFWPKRGFRTTFLRLYRSIP